MYRYIFNHTEEKKLVRLFDFADNKSYYSTIHYLSKYTYIEKTPIQNSHLYTIYDHTTNKLDVIDKNIFNTLKKNSLLTIQKRIYKKDTTKISVIEKPIKICIVETQNNQESLKECLLPDWDLFKRFIVIGGTFGSGKTEFAKGLSHTLNTKFGATSIYIPEYATDFIKKNRMNISDISIADQLVMYNNQRKREIDAINTLNICISDCPTFLSYIYALFIQSKNKTSVLTELYNNVLYDIKNYTDIAIVSSDNNCVANNNIRETSRPKQLKIESTIWDFVVHNNIKFQYISRDMINKYIEGLFFINEVGDLSVK